MLEVEVKFQTDIREIQKRLVELGFTKGDYVTESDTYFNGENKDLKSEDKALRIRVTTIQEIEEVTLNFKGPKIDALTMTRSETEFSIPTYKDGEMLLNGLGFSPAGRVEKRRLYYKKGNYTCCLDEVLGLGEFLEIEVLASENEYDDALNIIEDLLDCLGLQMEDSIRESYLCMLQRI